jgi:hypothetical protein
VALSLVGGAVAAHAQAPGAVSLDPNNARLGTALVVGLDAPAAPLTVTLPRGTRFNRRAVAPGTRIGSGRYVMNVQDFLAGGGGSTQLVWSLTATLDRAPGRVTITGALLGGDLAAAVLQPQLGTTIPATATTAARFVRSHGRVEFRMAALPAALTPAPLATATPARLELSLSGSRRIRQNFFHRVKVPTASGGFRIQRIRDHRLVSHDLLRTPRRCTSSWTYVLRTGSQRSTGTIPCLAALPTA